MKKYFLIIFTLTAFISGCKKSFLDLNENPNFPSAVPARSLLPAALVRTSSLMVDPNLDYINVWMQYWSFSPSYAVSVDNRSYKFTNTFRQGLFTNIYSNAFDYQKIIDFAIAQNTPALEGIGRVMKSMVVQMAVDVYNNVPYTDAFKGATNITPKYDDAKTIYESLYNDVTLGIAKLKIAQPTDFLDANYDLLFGKSSNSQAMWIKFANTIRLRLLMRQANRADRAGYISSKTSADFPNGLSSFLGVGELATINPGYTNSENKQSPFWGTFGYTPSGTITGDNDFFKASQFAVNFYEGQNDFRIFYFMKPAGSGSFFGVTFRGNEMGSQGTSTLTYSDICNNGTSNLTNGNQFRFPTDKQAIMTDFESLFLQAEAVQRGWFGGNAQNYFNNAVAQSFSYIFGPGGPSIQSQLIPTADNDWATATDKIRLIITQKWAALNTVNMLEPWCDYRRTGFPIIPLSSNSNRGPNVPVRYKYPQREYDLNGPNVTAQGNIDQFSSKIWWMP
jgi:hypothetical protein